MPELPDQTDIVAANERLTSELASAKSDLDAIRSDHSAISAKCDEAIANLCTVTKERDEAREQLAAITSERDKLLAVDRDFNRRLAAEAANHGIRSQAIGAGSDVTASAPAPQRKKTLTELSLEAKAAAGDAAAKAALANLAAAGQPDGRTFTERAIAARGA